MSELRDLYQEVIIDHNRCPRNFRILEDATHEAEGFNPLCGDRVQIFLKIASGIIQEVTFQGSGCAISTASASLLTEQLRGKSLAEARQLFDQIHVLLTDNSTESTFNDLGKLEVLSGVKEFPARVKCASLAWHTLRSALIKSNKPITTE